MRWLAAIFLFLAATPAAAQQIAITFDDLPVHGALPPGVTRTEIGQSILVTLKAAGTPPVYGFVNASKLADHPESEAVLKAWRAAGYPLGNHTWSHMRLSTITVEQFEADVIRNEPLLELYSGMAASGQDWRWLRYPYLSEGETQAKREAARAVLAGRGYRIASVTLDFADWAWNAPYARCVAANDMAAVIALEISYMAAAEESLTRARAMAQTLYGEDIPYVLLLHVGAFEARMLPGLLAFYKREGVRFISLEEAERHPFYADDYETRPVKKPVTLEGQLVSRGLPFPPETWDIEALAAVCP